jgi:hypothetical protein
MLQNWARRKTQQSQRVRVRLKLNKTYRKTQLLF